jgi:hypothetical protein
VAWRGRRPPRVRPFRAGLELSPAAR